MSWNFTLPSTLTRHQRFIIFCMKKQNVAKEAEQKRLSSRLAQRSLSANLCGFWQIQRRLNQIWHKKVACKNIYAYKKSHWRRQFPSPEKLNARQMRRLSNVSFRIKNRESYRQDTNSSGGFEEVMEVRPSDNEADVSVLRASHEEADTGLVLHCHHIRCVDSCCVSNICRYPVTSDCTFTLYP